MAIYAMSDIHGMYEPFMRRITQLNNLESVKAGKDKLVLLGDYIDVGKNSYKVLKTIHDLQAEIGTDNMIVILGNHDKWFIDFINGHNSEWLLDPMSFDTLESFLSDEENVQVNDMINHMEPSALKSQTIERYVRDCLKASHGELLSWLKQLLLYYKTPNQIFVHAGVDEEAEDWWETGTSDDVFLGKYPPTTGEFYMDIIAGHVSTSTASGNRDLHDIFFDGSSHFFIDGIDSYPYYITDEHRVIPLLIYEECDGKGKYFSLLESGEKIIIK